MKLIIDQNILIVNPTMPDNNRQCALNLGGPLLNCSSRAHSCHQEQLNAGEAPVCVNDLSQL